MGLFLQIMLVFALNILIFGTAHADGMGKKSPDTITHGNLTLEGPTGMFLNPTSSLLAKNEFTIQYCAAILEYNNNNYTDHYAIGSYGITDWLELGAVGRIWDLDRDGNDRKRSGAGPFAKIRLLKEERSIPEFTLGGISVNGADIIEKHTIFFAASKGLGLKEKGFPVDLRLHAGIRQFWFGSGDTELRSRLPEDVGGSGTNDHVGYVGGELALSRSIYLVSEVSTKPTGSTETPYSIGLQVRSHEGYGFSLAAIQTGNQDELGIFVGIGINFE